MTREGAEDAREIACEAGGDRFRAFTSDLPRGALVVVPTEMHVALVAQASHRGVTRKKFESELAASLLDGVLFADREQVALSLDDVLADLRETEETLRSPALASAKGWIATARAIDAAIGECRAGLIDDAMLREAASMDRLDSQRLRLVANALVGLDAKLLRAGLVDPRRRAGLLAQSIESSDPSRVRLLVASGFVVSRGIFSWSAADCVFWNALARSMRASGGVARVDLPSGDAPLDATRSRGAHEIVFDRLLRKLDDAPGGMSIDSPLIASRRDAVGAGDEPENAARCSVYRALDPFAEARVAARIVFEALRRGESTDEIAIAVDPREEALRELVRVECAARGIPCAIHPNAPSRFASWLKLLISEKAPREWRHAFADLFLAPYCAAIDEPLALSNAARRGDVTRVVNGTVSERTLRDVANALVVTPLQAGDSCAGALENTVLASTTLKDESKRKAAASLARRMIDRISSIHQERSRRDHVAALRDLLDSLGVAGRIDSASSGILSSHAASLLDQSIVTAVLDDVRAWRSVAAALDLIESMSDRMLLERPISFEQFRVELERLFESAYAARPPADAGAIRVASASELAFLPTKTLIVLRAAADGEASDRRGAFVDVSSLGESRAESDGSIAPNELERAEKMLALIGATANARTICVTSSSVDEQNRPIELAAWARTLCERGARVVDEGSSLETKFRRVHRSSRNEAAASVHSRAALERERESSFSKRDSVVRIDSPDARAVLIEESGQRDRSISITALEEFAQCKFKGYARSILRARSPSSAEETPDAREKGTLVHRAIDRAFSAAGTLWNERPRDVPRIVELALAAARDSLAAEAASADVRRYELERMVTDVEAVVRMAADDLNYDFAFGEQEFGRESSWRELVLEGDGVRVRTHGAIDRVDRAHASDAIRVIDYKLTASRAKQSAKKPFQLACYARAAAAFADTRHVEALYQSVRQRDLLRVKNGESSFVVSSDALLAADRDVLIAILSVSQGDIAPRPESESVCANCDADGACRKPRYVIAALDDDEAADSDL